MNIMLVSVTERTHEIGIRLSVGARPADIMRQFLIEATVICTLGGLIGIIGSGVAGMIFSLVTQEFTMVFTWPPILLACGFSALIGLGFGFSRRAMLPACIRQRHWPANEKTEPTFNDRFGAGAGRLWSGAEKRLSKTHAVNTRYLARAGYR
jgi:hypothetical protein